MVTRDALDRLQPLSLLDALNEVAGVRALSTGSAGGGSFLSVRGGEPNFSLVLIDGVRVNDPTNSKGGAYDFGTIDPFLVESIEISRGAGSAVHGSDALSGVVGIRLREPVAGAPALLATVKAGTAADVSTNLAVQNGWSNGGVLVSGGWFDSGDTDGSHLKRGQGMARARQRVGNFDLRVLALYAHTDRVTFPEDSGGPLLAINRQRERGSGELWTTAFSARGIQGGLRPNLAVTYSEQRDNALSPAIAPGTLSGVPAITARTRFGRLEAIGYLTLERSEVVASVGGAVLHEDGRSSGTINFGFPLPIDFALRRTTWSAFAETTLRPTHRLTLDAAGRVDAVDGGAQSWTGRAAISFRLRANGPTVYARAGTGFKLPSLYALGHPLVGNAALRPERSRDIEAGITWSPVAGSRFRLAVFNNWFRDLIDFDPVIFKTVNRASVGIRGFEAEARVTAGPVELTGALGHIAIDSSTPLRGRPRWQGNTRAAWRMSPVVDIDAAVRINSSFDDSSIPTGAIIAAGHTEIDVGLHYRLSRTLDLRAVARNIGDSRAQDAVGFPIPGASVRAIVSFRGF